MNDREIARLVAEQLTDRHVEISQQCTTFMAAEFGAVDDEQLMSVLAAAVRGFVDAILQCAIDEAPSSETVVPEASLTVARMLARKQVPLDSFMQACRLAYAEGLAVITRELRAANAHSSEVAIGFVRWSTPGLERLYAELSAAHQVATAQGVTSGVER